jgi:Fe2+ or Zn2+ uptake regulation protein
MRTTFLQPVPELICSHGLRCTRQRRVLFEALASTHTHPTAEALFEMVAPHAPDLSLATVYNTLKAFCRSGLAREFTSGNGTVHFDANIDNHAHFQDRRSGNLVDVPKGLSARLLASLPKDTIAQIEARLHCKVEQVHIEFVGQSHAGPAVV